MTGGRRHCHLGLSGLLAMAESSPAACLTESDVAACCAPPPSSEHACAVALRGALAAVRVFRPDVPVAAKC